MNFTKPQLEAFRIVLSDLDFIKQNWTPDATDDNLRRFSAILRNLLVDEGGLIKNAQEMLGAKIYLLASPNPLLIDSIRDIDFYSAGGAEYNGLKVQEMIVLRRNLSPKERAARFGKGNKPPLKKLSLDDYLKSPSIIFQGNIFTRIDLIKFVANKLGGTHYEMDKRKMARMRHLDLAKDTFQIAGKSSIYFEFLAIGQTISKGKYIEKLKKKIRETLSTYK